MMSDDEMQFGYVPERGTIVVVFILIRMLEENVVRAKKFFIFCEHENEK